MKHLTLRAARRAKRMTQQELERAAGVRQSRISEIESGITQDPNHSTVRALERGLGLRPGTLVFGVDEVTA